MLSKYKNELILIILFLLSRVAGLLSLHKGWDAYWLFLSSLDEKIATFRSFEGHPFYFGHITHLFHDENTASLINNLLIILLGGGITILNYRILSTLLTRILNKSEVLFLTAIISLTPYYDTSFTSFYAYVHYFIYLTYVALELTRIKSSKSKIHNLFLSLINPLLLFLSFHLNSLLFFHLPFILIFLFYKNNWNMPHYRFSQLKIIAPALIVPILFFIYKRIDLVYIIKNYDTNYNKVDVSSFLELPVNFIYSLELSFFKLIENTGNLLSSMFLIPILILTVILIYLFNKTSPIQSPKTLTNFDSYLLFFSFLMFFFGALPFCLAKKYPSFTSFSVNYHQLHLFIGTGGILFFSVRLLVKNNFQLPVYSIIISILILLNIADIIHKNKLALKEISIKENLIEKKDQLNKNAYIIVDDFKNYDIYKRFQFSYACYLAQVIFPDKKVLFAPDEEFNIIKNNLSSVELRHFQSYYHMSGFTPDSLNTIIQITKGTLNVSDLTCIKLMWEKKFHPEIFIKKIKSVTAVSIINRTYGK